MPLGPFVLDIDARMGRRVIVSLKKAKTLTGITRLARRMTNSRLHTPSIADHEWADLAWNPTRNRLRLRRLLPQRRWLSRLPRRDAPLVAGHGDVRGASHVGSPCRLRSPYAVIFACVPVLDERDLLSIVTYKRDRWPRFVNEAGAGDRAGPPAPSALSPSG